MKKLNNLQLRLVAGLLKHRAEELSRATEKRVEQYRKAQNKAFTDITRKLLLRRDGYTLLQISEASWKRYPEIVINSAGQAKIEEAVNEKMKTLFPDLAKGDEGAFEQVVFVSLGMAFRVPRKYEQEFKRADDEITKAILEDLPFMFVDLINSIGRT